MLSKINCTWKSQRYKQNWYDRSQAKPVTVKTCRMGDRVYQQYWKHKIGLNIFCPHELSRLKLLTVHKFFDKFWIAQNSKKNLILQIKRPRTKLSLTKYLAPSALHQAGWLHTKKILDWGAIPGPHNNEQAACRDARSSDKIQPLNFKNRCTIKDKLKNKNENGSYKR